MEEKRGDDDWFERLTGIPCRLEWWQIAVITVLGVLYAIFCG